MSMAPPVTRAKQTAATNMATYFRNSRPRNARKEVPPPGSSVKDFIRLHLHRRGGKTRRFGLLRWVTIPCWRAPIGEKSHPACFFCFGAGAAKCGRSLFVEISYSPIMGYSGSREARFGCRGANRASRRGQQHPRKRGKADAK